MDEKRTIKVLLAVGAVCLVVILFSNIMLSKGVMKLVSTFIPYIFCAKGTSGGFLLTEPLNSETCKDMERLNRFAEEQLCKYYEEEEKQQACTKLAEKIMEKNKACTVGGDVVVSVDEIARDCKTLLPAVGVENRQNVTYF